MLKSWSVGKPQILVQASVEKIKKKPNTTLFIEKIATISIIIINQQKHTTCI